MYNPLVIFTGAALATLAALLGVTYDKWASAAHDPMAAVEKKAEPGPGQAAPKPGLENMAMPAPAEAVPVAEPELASIAPHDTSGPPPEAAKSNKEGDASSAAAKPSFDTIRVEQDGTAVIAGRGLPDSDVTIMLDGAPMGIAKTDVEGAWVFIPDEPVPPGDHQLTLRMQITDALTIESEQSVALKVPERSGEKALVVLSDEDRPSRVLQKPERPTRATTDTLTDSAPADDAASAQSGESGEQLAAASSSLTLGTVDYDDSGEIIFSGRAGAGSSIRLYVNNKPVGEAIVTSEGLWTFAGNERIAPGTHSLRVDQLRPDGSVAERIELPFVRAAPQEVAALNKPAELESAEASSPQEESSTATSEPPASSDQVTAATQDVSSEPPAVAEQSDVAAQGSMITQESASEGAVSMEAPAAQAAAPAAEDASAMDPASPAEGKVASMEQTPPADSAGLPRNGKIVIQPGNSLWRISRVIYGRGIEYTVIYEANKDHIRDPDLIYPGQIFATPGVVPPETIDPKTSEPLAKTTATPTSQQ
jgi:nucleoid-associated protein YgaU